MTNIRVAIVAAALAGLSIGLPPGAAGAQCGNAYTDEMAGPGGTYGSSACSADETAVDVPQGAIGVGAAIEERNASARDNPDAPPVDRHTATFEGEREQ